MGSSHIPSLLAISFGSIKLSSIRGCTLDIGDRAFTMAGPRLCHSLSKDSSGVQQAGQKLLVKMAVFNKTGFFLVVNACFQLIFWIFN